ncbi:MAG TPA: HAMP domain-containing sensor histidine kinase [Acidimicrobiia bacterium]|nr:HAMP domain-containing sensor histidine kinase [Acidimicrobiia bacterium]
MTLLFRGIRFKVTAVAVSVLTLILVLGGVILVSFQRSSLTATIDEALMQRADDLSALIDEDPDSGGTFPAGAGEGLAQLVTADGRVLASTPNLSGAGPLPLEVPMGDSDLIRTTSGLGVDDDSFRLLTRPVGDEIYLHVGNEFEVVAEAAESLIGLLAIVLPLLILVSAGLTWAMVGRTLRPVEQIRAEVAEIESGALHRRVPRPGTGDEIDRLAETMNEMLARLESSIVRQRRFVADASHELRSPLTRIRSALELESRTGNPTAAGDEKDLLRDVIEMQQLVDDLLYLARADEGEAKPVLQAVDLDDVVIAEGQRLRADNRVHVDLRGVSGALVNGDPVQLRRAVRNLLENAQRHAKEHVAVSLSEQEGEAVLVVADDGGGIPEADFERVFERFTRLDDSRTAHTGGSGLGLAIAREIVQSHGGTLKLARSGTIGASFEVRLPLAQ